MDMRPVLKGRWRRPQWHTASSEGKMEALTTLPTPVLKGRWRLQGFAPASSEGKMEDGHLCQSQL